MVTWHFTLHWILYMKTLKQIYPKFSIVSSALYFSYMWTKNREKLHVIDVSFCVSPLDTCVVLITMTHAPNLLFLCSPLYYCLNFSCMVSLDQFRVVHYSIWQHTQVHGAAQWPHPSAACFLFIFMVPIQSAFHDFRNNAKAEEL